MEANERCNAFLGSLQDTLSTMAGLESELDSIEPADHLEKLERFNATLHFSGDHAGVLLISLNEHLAKVIGCNMLGMDESEITQQDVIDVVGELSNMVVGGAKTAVCQSGESMDLSIPTILDGLRSYYPEQRKPGVEIRAHVANDTFVLAVWMDGIR